MRMMTIKNNVTIEDTPWSDPVDSTPEFYVYIDKFPVTEGHTLFVPVRDEWKCIAACYRAAYERGTSYVNEGYCDGFNVGQNIGEAAGQTVMYPHIHLIPRREGDMEDPRGGVRHVIPDKGNYKK